MAGAFDYIHGGFPRGSFSRARWTTHLAQKQIGSCRAWGNREPARGRASGIGMGSS